METSKTILYVEDDPDTRELVVFLLTSEGYVVKATDQARFVLTLARSQRFDLYVVDNWLTDMPGIQLCQKIRRFDRTTPILFYSGAAHETDIAAAMEAGANGYLVKPASIDQLLSEIKRLIGPEQVAHLKA